MATDDNSPLELGLGRMGGGHLGAVRADRLRVILNSCEPSEAALGPSPQDANKLPPAMESGGRGGAKHGGGPVSLGGSC